ncbi:neutral zinc metallopeptidase [Actinokineospora sp. NPDC004072]
MGGPDGWNPLAPVQVAEAAPQRRNSPFALLAIFAMVLVGVLVIGVVGRAASGGFTTVVEGYASSVDGQAVPKEGQAQATLDAIARNPILRPGRALAQVTCELPELRTDPDGLAEYYRRIIACLDAAWTEPMEAAGKRLRTPELTVEDSPDGECGFAPDEEDAVAFYCASDEVISMPRSRLLDDAADDAGLHLAVLAHEYGHHIQALSGILGTAGRRERAAGDDEELELSRRVELQANCFAGLFIAAAKDRGDIDGDLADAAVAGFAYVEDSDSHGSANNQLLWAKAGYAGESTADCDTWSAAPSSVA